MANRLYIGNLLYQVQPEEIYDMLESANIKVDNVDMSIDPFSGRNPSYCFVDLASTENMQNALSRLQGARVRGRIIKINSDTGKRSHGPKQVRTQMANGEWPTFNMPPENSPMVFDRWSASDAREHWTKPVEEKRRHLVGGFSDISDQRFVNAEMRELFQGFDIQAVSKRVLPVHRNMDIPATGQCYCFVDLPSAEEAQKALLELDGKPTPYGGAYKVNVAYHQQDRKVCREQDCILGIKQVTNQPKRDLHGDWRAEVQTF